MSSSPSRRLTVLAPTVLGILPLVAALTVTSAPTAAAADTPVVIARTVAGFSDVKDATGATWTARRGLVGGDTVSRSLVGKDVLGTTDDELYRMSTYSSTGYQLPVDAGRYRVRLLMAEGYWTKAGQRVFDVTAEGATVLPKVDIVAGAGTATAYERSFDVDVRDGRLDVGFVKVVDNPLIAAVEVAKLPATPATPATPAAPEPAPAPTSPSPTPSPSPAPTYVNPASSTTGQAPVPLAADSPWTTRIEKAPLDPNSATMSARLRDDVASHWGGVAAFNNTHYNTSYYRVPADTPRVDVDFWNCQGKTWIDPNLTTGPAYFKQVPIPAGARPAVGTDGVMTIHDPATDQLWEFWQMRRNTTTNRWEACWGGRIDQLSTGMGIFPKYYGASASGVALAAGMISLDEVRRGSIDHALYLAVMNVQAYPEMSWPALRTDGNVVDPGVVREGQRLRLDPSVDLSAYDLTPVGRMIAVAAQRYGFIVADKGGAVAVIAESGMREQDVTGTSPWPGLLGGLEPYEVMRNFPWDRIQVVQADYGKPADQAPAAS